jgi:hypothetical protein
MKKIVVLFICTLMGMELCAQKQGSGASQKGRITKYETFIYTSDNLDRLIQKEYNNADGSRGFLSDLLGASVNAGKGIAGGYVSSFIDMGVGAIAGLITQNSANKLKWEEIVKEENRYEETISTVESINNFYSKPSFDGPLDPQGMTFNGIGCLRTEGNDTVFFISCHIDQTKINRIVNHSKFELSLDTLIINPYHCDLPNSTFDNKFSFDKRKNLQITLEMHIFSSWMTVLPDLQKNQELGSFTISVPINPADLNEKGELRYARKEGEAQPYKIVGESFIIPRSFMGYRDKADNTYKDRDRKSVV